MATITRGPAAARLAAQVALAAAFLSAVADRFGFWGPPGAPSVAWGEFPHFVAYTAQTNGWWLGPGHTAVAATLAWLATLAELGLGIALLLGMWIRQAAIASAGLLAVFAVALTAAFGPKPALDYSVWSAAAAALLLAMTDGPDLLTLGRAHARQRG